MFPLLLACAVRPEPSGPDAPESDHAVQHEPETPARTDCFVDGDEDGWGSEPITVEGPECSAGAVATGGDCDDADARRNPVQAEVCDDLDNDCDEMVDFPVPSEAPIWYADVDGDGFGDATAPLAACDAPEGYLADAGDCDDSAADAFPGGEELCEDGLDGDCAGDGDGLCRINGDWAVDELSDARWLGEDEADTFGLGVAVGDLDLDGSSDVLVAGATNDGRRYAGAAFHGLLSPIDGGWSEDANVLASPSEDVQWRYYSAAVPRGLEAGTCGVAITSGVRGGAGLGEIWVLPGCAGALSEADAVASGVGSDSGDFGRAVASVVDSDGDGAAELLVGAQGNAIVDGSWRDEHGRAYLFLDPLNELDAADADVVFDTPAEAEWMSLGSRVCSADFDGDGLSDAAMSAPGYGYGYATLPSWGRGGAVFVAFAPFAAQTDLIGIDGTPGDSVLVYTTSDEDGMLGHYLSCGGDLDGDGLPELLIGDEYEGNTTGRVYVQSPRVPGSTAADSVGWRIDGSAPGELFANGLATEPGDLDGDGRDDLVIAATPGAGVLDIFYGGSTANRTSADADAVIVGPYAFALGDFNGDGISDIAAGQADDSTVAHWSGAVSIILGGSLEP